MAYDDKQTNEGVTVALITTIMGSCLSYMLYQYKLKDSRNRYHINEDGIPYNEINRDHADNGDHNEKDIKDAIDEEFYIR